MYPWEIRFHSDDRTKERCQNVQFEITEALKLILRHLCFQGGHQCSHLKSTLE